MRAELMQECHPLSIWNYLILLGDSNKNNNNEDLQSLADTCKCFQVFPRDNPCSQPEQINYSLHGTASVVLLVPRSGYGEPQTILLFFVDA